jgi:hypothetical protein
MQIWLVEVVDAETGQTAYLVGTPHAGRIGFSRRRIEATPFEGDEAEDAKAYVEELLGRAVRVAVTA